MITTRFSRLPAFLRLSLASLTGLLCAGALRGAGLAASLSRATVAGIDVVAYHTGVQDVVTLEGSLPAGEVFHPASNLAVPALVAQLLDKGTTTEDKFAISRRLEAVGASIEFRVGAVNLNFSAKCLRKDLPLVISVLAEELRTPAFSQDEFDKAKRQLSGEYLRQLEDTEFRAENALGRALFPVGHPNHPASAEDLLAALDSARLDDVRAFHAAHFGPAHMILVGVGDLDPAQLQAEVAKAFAGWTGGRAVPSFAPASPVAGSTSVLFVADKSSVNIAWGCATGLRYGDADALPLRIGTAILGRGFTGRLMATVRDQEGLTYGIGAATIDDTYADGEFLIYATFAPSLLGKGVASTRRELTGWWEKGVTAAELDSRKSNLIGSYKVGLSTTAGMASQILATLQRGLPLSWLDDYPALVQAVTLEQVNGAIRRHLDPAKMVLVEAGTVPAAK